jgi:hypothetical protein
MKPKISIVIPFHWMENWQFFLTRCLKSIENQTFKDYEIVLMKHSTMPVTSNIVIAAARGEVVKVLYMDDWLDNDNYLEVLNSTFFDETVNWLITAATTNKYPAWTDDIETGNNKLGSPSALAFRNYNADNEFFDFDLSWLLDCDLYKRLEKRFGKPVILKEIEVGIGIHSGQMTHILTDEQKLKEVNYLKEKYG